jgi:excisionase family DNA binding protein
MNDTTTPFENCGLLTVGETTQFLKISKTTLYRLMRDGRIEYALIGKSRRVPKPAVLAFIAKHVRKGTPSAESRS